MLTTMIIGNKIAEARKKINISQAQLAQRLFISSQAVGKWERGESMPDIITFNRLTEILGVDLNYFSESFQTEATESDSNSYRERMAPVESVVKQSDELPSGKHPDSHREKKLSWDMSRGNWVDADFSGLKNLHEKFSSSNMQRCLFIGSDMSGLLLKSNNVVSCDFSGSDMSNSHLQSSNLGNNLFKDCKLKETEFSGSNISSCNFSGTDFTGAAFLKSNHVDSCDFSGSDFSNIRIQGSNLGNNLFKDCSLKESEISGSYIMGCDFSGADFTGAAFKSGGIQKNKMANVVWNRTSFNTMQIVDIVFEGTVEDCYFENCTFKKVTFQNATLTNSFFKNKSLKGIRFIDCQADRMTYEFLKSGKADLTGITLLTPKGGNE
jgi:uncharacterized protein YjbI with pentapeptide repeats